jgi:hypothetical protein
MDQEIFQSFSRPTKFRKNNIVNNFNNNYVQNNEIYNPNPIIPNNRNEINNEVINNYVEDDDEYEDDGDDDEYEEDGDEEEIDDNELNLSNQFINTSPLFYQKFMKKNHFPYKHWKEIYLHLENLWQNGNDFVKFVENKGRNCYFADNSSIPLFYKLLEKYEMKQFSFEDDISTKLPSGINISKREIYLLRELISKKFKSTTDTNEEFLDDIFEYIFGDIYSNKERKKYETTKFILYYCFCNNNEYNFENIDENKNKSLFEVGDVCFQCKNIIKREDRVEISHLLEKIFSLLKNNKLKSGVQENLNRNLEGIFGGDTIISDSNNGLMSRFYFSKGLFNMNEGEKVFSVGLFNDDVTTSKHSYKGKYNSIYLTLNGMKSILKKVN